MSTGPQKYYGKWIFLENAPRYISGAKMRRMLR